MPLPNPKALGGNVGNGWETEQTRMTSCSTLLRDIREVVPGPDDTKEAAAQYFLRNL